MNTKTVDYHRFIFRTTRQESGETFQSFYDRLCIFSQKCEFVDWESQMKDQIIEKSTVIEIRDSVFNNDMTLSQLVFSAKTFEAAQSNFQGGNGHDQRGAPLRAHPQQYQVPYFEQFPQCTRCGSRKHNVNDNHCPGRMHCCKTCNRVGHFARMCHTGKRKVAAERFKKELVRNTNTTPGNSVGMPSTSRMEVDDTVTKSPSPQAVSTPSKIETVVTGINVGSAPKTIEMPPQNINVPTQVSTSSSVNAAIVIPPKLIPATSTAAITKAPTPHMIKSLPRIPRKISGSGQSPDILQSPTPSSSKSSPVFQAKKEPGLDEVSSSEKIFECSVGGKPVKCSVKDIKVSVASKGLFRKLRSEKFTFFTWDEVSSTSGNHQFIGSFSAAIKVEGQTSSSLEQFYVQDSLEEYLIVKKAMAKKLKMI